MSNKGNYLEDIKQKLEHYTKSLAQIKDDIKHKTSKDYQAVLDSSEQGLKNAVEAYEKLKSATEDNWEQLKASTAQIFTDLGQSFKDLGVVSLEDSSQSIQRLSKEIRNYIKHNPLASSLIGVGIGFILGKIFK